MSNLIFRKRKETKAICIQHKDMNGMSFTEIYRHFVQRGELGTGYHYYVNTLGIVTEDRKLDEIAGWDYKNNETSVYILVDCKKGRANDSQQYEINKLISQIEGVYKDIVIENL